MSIAISDIEPKVKDYCRNQNLTDARVIRAIETAAGFVLNHLGVPGYEREYTFDFFEDQLQYTLPSGFGEALSLRYKDNTLNLGFPFKGRQGETIFNRSGLTGKDTKVFGPYVASGVQQLLVLARNTKASLTIDSMDSSNSTNWVASNDATNITDDAINYKEGAGSLKFDINVALSVNDRASLKKTVSATDLSTFKDIAQFKVWWYVQATTNLSSITLKWGSDASNYFSVTETLQEDGTAFSAGAWNKVAWAWLGATQVGSPDTQNITFYEIDIDYTAAFASSNNWRFDFLRLLVPDSLILTYYTTFVGQNNSGTDLSSFTATTDVFLFASFDPVIREMIALEAAIIISPTLLVDNQEARKLYKEFTYILQKRYPRKRGINVLADPSTSRTSFDPTA